MDETIYKRNITWQLFFLRTIPLLVFILIIILLVKDIYDYAIFLAVLLAPTFFLMPTQVILDKDNIEIKKYSLLSFINKTHSINTNNLVSIKRHVEEIDDLDEEVFFTLTSTIILFTYKNDKGEEQSVRTKLNVKEYMTLLPKIED